MTRALALIGITCAISFAACKRDAAPAGTGEPPASPAANRTSLPDGAVLYARHCAMCHMADGGGVPFVQPSLLDSAVVRGDTRLLARVVLDGPAAVLPANREHYDNEMPGFATLADAEIAALLTHVRREFGGGSGPVTEATVANARALP